MSEDYVVPETEISVQKNVNDKKLFSDKLKG